MATQKKTGRKRVPTSNVGGRPARPMPELIPDSPENIAKACMVGPPEKRWRHVAGSGN